MPVEMEQKIKSDNNVNGRSKPKIVCPHFWGTLTCSKKTSRNQYFLYIVYITEVKI